MRKFGKKNMLNFDSEKNINMSMEYDDDEDNFYQREFSKKLKNVNKLEKDSEENYFLFKKNKKNSNSNLNLNSNFPNNTSTLKENSHQEQKSKKKVIRLSELENSNLYYILNIDEGSSKEDIKRAYKNMLKQASRQRRKFRGIPEYKQSVSNIIK